MNRWLAIATLVLGVAFLSRVAGQFLQVVSPVDVLPPLESWQGSNMPYPALLIAQIAIVGLIGWVSARMAAGQSVIARRWGKPVIALGAMYFGVMAVRLVLGLAAMAHVKWFAASIPASFHLVLASAVMLTGAYAHMRPSRSG